MTVLDPAQRLAVEASRQQLADAYLLVGPAESYLRQTALRCAAILLQAHGAVEQHADLVVLDPEALGVDGLRVEHIAYRKDGVPCLEEALRYRPVVSPRRAVLLYGADRMTADAHAALLKTTEEPPAETTLIFTARELHGLSPALRSRCRIWRVPPRPQAELRKDAAARGWSTEDWGILGQVYGSGEATLDAPEADTRFLLDHYPRLASWLTGAEAWSWCVLPEASALAEQRRLAVLLLQAAQAWLLTAAQRPQSGASVVAASRHRRLSQAIDDLLGQVSPALVVEDLRRLDQVTQDAAS